MAMTYSKLSTDCDYIILMAETTEIFSPKKYREMIRVWFYSHGTMGPFQFRVFVFSHLNDIAVIK